MKRPGILLFNLFIMVGYSLLFTLLGTWIGGDVIGLHWGVLCIHIIVLLILGLSKLGGTETKKDASHYLLASLLVAIIGHGLCFFNGLLHMSV